MDSGTFPRLLVFIVAYNAEKTIERVVGRIPARLADLFDVEVLVIDDASRDGTFEQSHRISQTPGSPFPIRVLFNPVNQGYGGNQKLGYQYALQKGFDFVALLHGDAQYAPECLPELLEPLRNGQADIVFGSRMLPPSSARQGGMPLYKFAGNRVLTWIENKLLHANLSEFHSGYRIYSTEACGQCRFDRNSNGFDFDTEIIIQALVAKLSILELPIPTYYGDEICYVNGVAICISRGHRRTEGAFARDGAVLRSQVRLCATGIVAVHAKALLSRVRIHWRRRQMRPGSAVLDLGCAGGYMARVLKQRRCKVTGVDSFPTSGDDLNEFYLHDLDDGFRAWSGSSSITCLMLDVIEHLRQPELFLDQLRKAVAMNPKAEVILSTGNVGFFVTRMMLLVGEFNYGRRGILDLTHTRLFTFGSFRRAVEQAGFNIEQIRGVPGPFPLALGDNAISRMLVRLNAACVRICPGLFSYQIFMRVRPRPVLESLLAAAEKQSAARIDLLELHRAIESDQVSTQQPAPARPK